MRIDPLRAPNGDTRITARRAQIEHHRLSRQRTHGELLASAARQASQHARFGGTRRKHDSRHTRAGRRRSGYDLGKERGTTVRPNPDLRPVVHLQHPVTTVKPSSSWRDHWDRNVDSSSRRDLRGGQRHRARRRHLCPADKNQAVQPESRRSPSAASVIADTPGLHKSGPCRHFCVVRDSHIAEECGFVGASPSTARG